MPVTRTTTASTTHFDAWRVTCLVLVSFALVGHALVFDFVNDDAFISFRYAENLAHHGQLVFNLDERVEGYTNFLWTLLMAGVIELGLDPVSWSKWIGIALGVATLWVVARFTAHHQGRSRWDAAAPALLAAAPAYACWCTGGLETQLFTFLVTLAWTEYLLERERVTASWPRSGVYFALSAMTRPEGVLLFALTGLHRLVELRAVEQRVLPTRRDWIRVAGFLVVFTPFFVWRWGYYGFPLPNTYYAKAGGAALWSPGLRYMGGWVIDHHIWVVPLLVLGRRAATRTSDARLFSLVGTYSLVLSAHVIHVGGDFMALYRFLVPIMPMLAVAAAVGGRSKVTGLLAAGVAGSRLAVAGAVGLGLLVANVARIDARALEIHHVGNVDSIGWLNAFALQCTAIGKHLGEVGPPDATLAVTAAGAIPYYSRLQTLDVLGLNDEWVAHNVPSRGNRPGHTKRAPMTYVLGMQIDYLIFHPDLSDRPQDKIESVRASWNSLGYRWQTIRVPDLDPPCWGVWVRQTLDRDS